MAQFASHLEKFAVETFSVVLGIALAFGVNAWHDRRVHAAAACEALREIRSELAANDSALQGEIPYHLAMRDSLRALLARTHGPVVPGGLSAIKNWRGTHTAQPLDDAWQAARSTEALEYLPYDLVIQLSRGYAMQQQLTDINRGFYGAVFTPAFATGGTAALATMESYITDLASGEQHLEARLATERRLVARTCQ